MTIVVVVVTGFAWGRGDWAHFAQTSSAASLSDLFEPATISVFFTYSGWFVSSYVASEIKASHR